MLLHDPLDVLATNSDDAFVILIRHMKRDRGWHLLLNEAHALLHRFIGWCNNVNIKVILSETIKDNLDIT
jgi:hypothetical protein